jgi:hypothetical protein
MPKYNPARTEYIITDCRGWNIPMQMGNIDSGLKKQQNNVTISITN